MFNTLYPFYSIIRMVLALVTGLLMYIFVLVKNTKCVVFNIFIFRNKAFW